ncbi:carboxylesterase/lipase family protein [Thermomonas carbonis]|uniref:Carboxylic ester hydrolase n=1 Tax=Thermomonas carbonis TaxID=1463158 RepID=A0A7G9STF6_9GAMM|nr:carboxylesterase family protein [Thermomonas carbonis]QNN71131.1 carboxylesterase/lipase family protein [Thermomonas carbonis]GHC11775.1 carboxylic ester hydrolase [Thermomonas carbonis]
MDRDRRHLLKASLALALAASAPGFAATGIERSSARTRSGRILGLRSGDLHVFRGIRYGADTSTHRFQPPQREAPWRGARDASAFGSSAPQGGNDGPGSEDCLFLNVTTPGLRDGKRRPILFYIHGGGFNNGSGSDPLYDGRQLCTHGDVVVVTVNHRLNAFGYLYLGELDERFAESGNVGQLDLIAALQWVREHAAEFGGDAGNVTVFGQSGGGAKIATLMAMPAARGLFHRAWTMSGQQVTAAGPRAAAQRAKLMMDALGARDVDALLRIPAATLIEALRTRDPSRVEDTALYFGPVLAGEALPRHPFWPDAPSQSASIPMVIGNTRDETRAFLGNDPGNFALTWDTLPAKLRAQQFVDLDPNDVIAEYRRLYPQYTPSEVFFAATTAGRSWRGAVEELEVRARDGRGNTWAYQLDWYPRDVEGGEQCRAFHTLDIPLVFDTIAQPGSRTGISNEARAVATSMRDALLAFARSGDPRTGATTTWSPYSLPRRETMVFGATPAMQDDPRGGERALYQRVPFVQRGTF